MPVSFIAPFLALMLIAGCGRAAHGFSERPVAIGLGERALHGTLMLPPVGGAGLAQVPGVLVLAGSGPVDRDGNLPGLRNDSLVRLCQALAAQGIASLRVDKRGIGASRRAAPPEAALRFATYVADAAAWLALLRAEPGIGRVFLLGHSEGALVATRVARQQPVDGLVLLAGAGQRAGALLARQLAAAALPPPLQEAALRILAALEQGTAVPAVPPELMPLFRPSVQPYLASWLALDPAAELAAVAVPTLIVQGTTDLQVGLDDAERLLAARPDAARAIIPGMNHVLRQAPAARADNLATYGHWELPLAPGLVPPIAAFLHR